jgi:hypothetical protein
MFVLSEKRIELMELILAIGEKIKDHNSYLLPVQTIDDLVSKINERIVANDEIEEDGIKALFDFFTKLDVAHRLEK